MVNIPNKSDGDVLSASNLFKLAGSDNTGGSVGATITETTIATVSLDANQLSTVALLLASVALEYGDFNVSSPVAATATFRLKRDSTTLSTLTLKMFDVNAEDIDGPLKVGGSFTYADTGATFSGAVTYTITCELNTTYSQINAYCYGFSVVGV